MVGYFLDASAPYESSRLALSVIVGMANRALADVDGAVVASVLLLYLNWKELETSVLTLQHLQQSNIQDIRGSTVFYFTDISVA